MKLKKGKQPKKSTILLFALIIFIVGILAISYNYLVAKKEKVYSSMNLLLYEDETPKDVVEDTDSSEEEPENTNTITENENSNKNKISYKYIGTLTVKKINLKRGFLDINSPYNNVGRNVTVIKESSFPDVKNGNLILAAHSGNCTVCYFDKLYKLSLGDVATVSYGGHEYTYKLVNIYNVPKTGQVEIKRNPSTNVLTLITCTHNSDTEQTVYIFELENTK